DQDVVGMTRLVARSLDRTSRAGWVVLNRESHARTSCSAHFVRFGPDDDDTVINAAVARRGDDMAKDWPSRQRMRHFCDVRAHPGPLPRCHDDGRPAQLTIHCGGKPGRRCEHRAGERGIANDRTWECWGGSSWMICKVIAVPAAKAVAAGEPTFGSYRRK